MTYANPALHVDAQALQLAEDLNFVRGLIYSVGFSLPLWGLIIATVWIAF